LAGVLTGRSGERHVVAIQDFPDPDAISSGLAYREIARQFGVEVDIMYDGQISHPENLALVNLLDLHLIQYSQGMQLDRYHAAVYVDNQGTTTHLAPRLQNAGVETLAVIDHHDAQELLDPRFRDVRPVAAAATLFAGYFQSGQFVEMNTDNPRHVQLATALMHGIHSETDGFVYAAEPEYRAAAYLSHFVDGELLERILCVEKSHGTMTAIQAALAARTLHGGLSIAGAGYVRWADRDAIPQAADFLLTEEDVHTVVIYGILTGEDGREVVSGSLRTNKATLGVDAFLKQALGTDIQGRPYGGGRSRAGGFEIPIRFLAGGEDDPENRHMKWKLYDRQIRRKLLEAAGLAGETAVIEPSPFLPLPIANA
jgi:nanoRNase/pAp phosphatase (c-di-AMP/oligoRNAs hydrolase)